MRDIFVVAGNRHEFANLLNHAYQHWDFELKNRMVHYVSSPLVLEGVKFARLFCYGTYFKRKDWPILETMIQHNGMKQLLIR